MLHMTKYYVDDCPQQLFTSEIPSGYIIFIIIRSLSLRMILSCLYEANKFINRFLIKKYIHKRAMNTGYRQKKSQVIIEKKNKVQ